MCSLWLCESIVANPIIYRLVPRPSRFEIRQWPAMSESNTYTNLFSKAWIHHSIMEKCQSQQISAKTLPITSESQPSTGPIPTSLHAIRNNSLLVGIFSLADSRKMPNHNFFIYILLRYIRQIWSSQCLYIGQTWPSSIQNKQAWCCQAYLLVRWNTVNKTHGFGDSLMQKFPLTTVTRLLKSASLLTAC